MGWVVFLVLGQISQSLSLPEALLGWTDSFMSGHQLGDSQGDGETWPHSLHPAGSRALSHSDGHRCPTMPTEQWIGASLAAGLLMYLCPKQVTSQAEFQWMKKQALSFIGRELKVTVQSCLNTGQDEFVATSNLLQHSTWLSMSEELETWSCKGNQPWCVEEDLEEWMACV